MELVYQSQSAAQRDEDSVLVYELIGGTAAADDVAAIERSRGIGPSTRLRVICAQYPQTRDASLFLVKSSFDLNIDHLLCAVHESYALLVVNDDLFGDDMLSVVRRCAGSCTGIGISRTFTSLESFPNAFSEASSAIRIARRLGRDDEIIQYVDLAPYHLLEAASGLGDLMRFVDPAVKRIIAYDEENGTQLADTLKSYVDSGRNMNACAERLYTHRNTVHYRLGRIREITDLRLENDDRWFAIALSFRILEILES